jgi:hypothetical protein
MYVDSDFYCLQKYIHKITLAQEWHYSIVRCNLLFLNEDSFLTDGEKYWI